MSRAELEVCVDTAAALLACWQAGLDRIELCSALAVGGLTPSHGFMSLAGKAAIVAPREKSDRLLGELDVAKKPPARPQVLAMIRPRSGNFCFSGAETDVMCNDIAAARHTGLDGVVLGAATVDGKLDLPVLNRLCEAADGMPMTLHRVIDLLEDPFLAIDQAVDLGFARILTSGGAVVVADGLTQLTQMHRYAGDRIQIMAGAGLTPALVTLIRSQIGIKAFHASCRSAAPGDRKLSAFGFSGGEGALDPVLIKAFRQSLAVVRD